MKKIFLLLVLLLTSGCTVNYNLTIDENNKLHEEILIQAENPNESLELYADPWPIKAYYNDPDSGEYPEELDGVDYYKNEFILNNNLYQKKLTYSSELEKFNDINSIKSCYENFYVTEDTKENTITLSTSPKFLCMTNYPKLNEVNIRIKVSNPVTANNATKVNGDTYEWTITKENYQTSAIVLTYSQDDRIEKEHSSILLILGIFGVFCVVIVSVIVYKIKMNK